MLKKLLSYIFPIHLHKTESIISKTIEVTLYNGKLVLDSKNTNYSYGSLQRVLRFGLKQIGFEQIKKMQNILILGVAGGSVIKTLVDEIEYKGKIKGVEIDKNIIEIANTYFSLDKIPNLEIIITDARQFVKTKTEKYDLIIIDVFQDKEMPAFLFNKEFTDNVISLLNYNGIILFNTMKTNKKEAERNDKYKLNYSQKNFDILAYSDLENYNEILIVKQKS
ncbi:MAG: fused MFS/spermidine synthase [Flavobacteriaceae bacterium]